MSMNDFIRTAAGRPSSIAAQPAEAAAEIDGQIAAMERRYLAATQRAETTMASIHSTGVADVAPRANADAGRGVASTTSGPSMSNIIRAAAGRHWALL
jgi:rhamnose utilization protein RhaD (predicted bifunctional aldolase and dehydrogenase)